MIACLFVNISVLHLSFLRRSFRFDFGKNGDGKRAGEAAQSQAESKEEPSDRCVETVESTNKLEIRENRSFIALRGWKVDGNTPVITLDRTLYRLRLSAPRNDLQHSFRFFDSLFFRTHYGSPRHPPAFQSRYYRAARGHTDV